MNNITFQADVAAEYGVDEAIMIAFFQFWIEKNHANKRHNHDERTWTYNSQVALTRMFHFWSRKQIRRIMASLISQGVLITGEYNKQGYDRTTWYAFEDQAKWLKTAKTNKCPNGPMDMPKRANPDAQKGQPIPVTYQLLTHIENLNLEAWAKWIEYRKAAKYKKYKTDATAQNLAKYPQELQARAVEHSINNEYQGLFPEKLKNETHKQNNIVEFDQQGIDLPSGYSDAKKAGII